MCEQHRLRLRHHSAPHARTPAPVYPVQLYGNKLEPGQGRQMPIHYGSKELNYQTVSSPLATQLPHAAGAAYGMKVGGGCTAESTCWMCGRCYLLAAGLRQCLFCCEDAPSAQEDPAAAPEEGGDPELPSWCATLSVYS